MSNSGENTKIEPRVDDQHAEWLLAFGDRKWIGPLTVAAIVRKLLRHEVSPGHWVWKKGMAQWQRIQDTKEFHCVLRELAPQAPGGESGFSGAGARREWYLARDGRQYGPYTADDLSAFIRSGKVNGQFHAWKPGMAAWERLSALAPASRNAENRSAPRCGLVAKVLFTDDQSVIEASGQDISESGMLVVTGGPGSLPCEVGDKIRVNVSPRVVETPGNGVFNGMKIKAFVAEGRIVRTLSDGRGFSFRFEKLSENARRAIEAYIHTAA